MIENRVMRPVIGITTNGAQELDFISRYYSGYYSLADLYVQAVREAGAIPILLPPGEQHREQLLQLLDGIILTGGSDVQPIHYDGDSAHAALTIHDPQRDEQELALVNMLVERPELPVLCICRGMQVLNVALGGSLYEHIPDIGIGDIHRGADSLWTVHEVTVSGSALRDAMGTDQVFTYSGHHQAAKTIAPDLEVIAQAPDGIVEALQHRRHPWMIGVQWHPEKSAAQDPTQQALFHALVKAVKKNY
jgi:putative glutamine amidotransferase